MAISASVKSYLSREGERLGFPQVDGELPAQIHQPPRLMLYGQ